jgi:hypothetical protein
MQLFAHVSPCQPLPQSTHLQVTSEPRTGEGPGPKVGKQTGTGLNSIVLYPVV